jgi:glycosyltransferase involved in cell wall biosynthesis
VAKPADDKVPLTVAVITLNAGARLDACLASAGFADELLVVDSGSTDDTVEVARRHGARVESKEWLGFGRQKQHAVALARHDWVLCLDSDERVTEGLERSIREAMAAPRYHAYRFTRRNRFLGRWLAHGEGYPDWCLRLFHRAHAGWSGDEVHEVVLTTAQVGRLEGDLLHESVEDIATYLAKHNRFSTAHAQMLYSQGTRTSPARVALSPVIRFAKYYVFRLGFLDGIEGMAHCLIGAWYSFVKHLKLYELQGGHGPAAARQRK